MESDENGVSAQRGGDGHAIDDALRARVDHAMTELKRRLDAVIAQPTTKNLNQLRNATDEVMRAGARVLIELGRR